MPFDCHHGRCQNSIHWMGNVLFAAGIYHLVFAVVANLWPFLVFDWIGIERPNHPVLWNGVGIVAGVLGVCFLLASRDPIQHWLIVTIGFGKVVLTMFVISSAVFSGDLPPAVLWLMLIDDAVWFIPFLLILWACLRAFAGVPPSRSEPLSITEAAGSYTLSNGKTLEEASESQLLALVFLRHFGCTFTRQILRGLESIQKEAHAHGAELVLVHMLQNGKEMRYLGERSGVTRIADPRCELYRAFGLGKGGFLELFGPHVWWRGAVSIFKGCGLGHLAGDGLQMPGAFLFLDGKIISSQRAHSASDLPDLPGLFQALPSPAGRDTVSA
jgi:hypothetical protein